MSYLLKYWTVSIVLLQVLIRRETVIVLLSPFKLKLPWARHIEDLLKSYWKQFEVWLALMFLQGMSMKIHWYCWQSNLIMNREFVFVCCCCRFYVVFSVWRIFRNKIRIWLVIVWRFETSIFVLGTDFTWAFSIFNGINYY